MIWSDIFCLKNSLWYERYFAFLVTALPIFLLTTKGWGSSVGILIFLSAIYGVFALNCICGESESTKGRRWGLLLTAPLIVESLVSALRYVVNGDAPHLPSYDNAGRYLIGACFLFFALRSIKIYLYRPLAIGCGIGLLFLIVNFLIFPEYFWGGDYARAATAILDPNTVGVFSVGLAALAYFAFASTDIKVLSWILRPLILCLAFWGSLGTESRSAMLAMFAFYSIVIIYETKGALYWRFILFLLFPLGIFYSWQFGFAVYRIDDYVRDIFLYFQHGTAHPSSIGLRIELWTLDWLLLKAHPILGIKDGALPSMDMLRDASGIMFTPEVYEQKILSGSHTEYMAWLVKQGIFGFISLVSIFFAPLIFFLKRACLATSRDDYVSWAGLSFILVVMAGGVGIQVLNMKLASTFFSLSLAVLISDSIKRQSESAAS